MAEDTRRSFDLNSWQGLTEVLKCARDSKLSPEEYSVFRNLVLGYSQKKGSDPELKKQIDAYIARFAPPASGEQPKTRGEASTNGRRVVPSFQALPPLTHAPRVTAAPKASAPVPPPVPHSEETAPVPTPLPDEHTQALRASEEGGAGWVDAYPPTPTQHGSDIGVPPPEVPAPPEVVPEAPPLPPITTTISYPTQVGGASPIPVPPAFPAELKSIEEHRARITDIKRRVNATVGNPVSLMDNGNHIGREYMGALLTALKATSPGTTLNIEASMEALEAAYTKVMAFAGHGESGTLPPLSPSAPAVVSVSDERTILDPVLPPVQSEPEPVPPTSMSDQNVPPREPAVSVPVREVPVVVDAHILEANQALQSEIEDLRTREATLAAKVAQAPQVEEVVAETKRVMQEEIRSLREELKAHEHDLEEKLHTTSHHEPDVSATSTWSHDTEPASRPEHTASAETPVIAPALPSVRPHDDLPFRSRESDVDTVSEVPSAQALSIKEKIAKLKQELHGRERAPRVADEIRPIAGGALPSAVRPAAVAQEPSSGTTKVNPQWNAVLDDHKQISEDVDLRALTRRPESNTTGISLGTPQADLVSPEVTMALTELLHEWNIFASSGIFGLGPGGIDHPLYVKLAKLPMGEVLTGRFENPNQKVVRTIKDYVDAWRHEQGVAYNPTETFEHYLRRVAQRILKRRGQK